ncbi:MAG: nucleotidyltransferase domain-containing protein [Gemmatimonadota bacterium]
MSEVRKPAREMTAALRSEFGDALESVVLFGSVPRGEAVAGVSDLNLLVILDDLSGPRLIQAAPLVQDWIRAGNTPPHLYSAREWEGMRDTFTIELADMGDAREVLLGRDPVDEGGVSFRHLRLHAEQEVRETLLHLRLRLLLSAHDGRDVARLLMAGMPSFVAYMRAALRLIGESPGLRSGEVIRKISERMGIAPDPMITCWEVRRDRLPLHITLDDPMLAQYLEWVQGLVEFLDRLPENTGTEDLP